MRRDASFCQITLETGLKQCELQKIVPVTCLKVLPSHTGIFFLEVNMQTHPAFWELGWDKGIE